jgi:hypothetical protein
MAHRSSAPIRLPKGKMQGYRPNTGIQKPPEGRIPTGTGHALHHSERGVAARSRRAPVSISETGDSVR